MHSGDIRIGCINYAINEVETLEDDHGNEIYGQALYDICEIRILKRLEQQAKSATLWHEIVHAILVNAGYTGDHDEQMVSAIAHGIYAALVDNPGIGSEG